MGWSWQILWVILVYRGVYIVPSLVSVMHANTHTQEMVHSLAAYKNKILEQFLELTKGHNWREMERNKIPHNYKVVNKDFSLYGVVLSQFLELSQYVCILT